MSFLDFVCGRWQDVLDTQQAHPASDQTAYMDA